jgi:hypothetical protein
MPIKKIDKKVLFSEMDTMAGLERKKIIDKIILNHGFTEGTADIYYAQWKKEFMKEGHAVPNEAYEPKTIKTNKPPRKVIENIGDLNAVIKPWEPTKAAEKSLENGFKEIIKESESIPFIPLKKPIEFIPVVFKGKYFEYKITKEGLKINSGVQDIITYDCIEEQQEALKLWDKYKGVI